MNKNNNEHNNYFPNVLHSINNVWSSNKVWVSDIFDYTFTSHQRKTVVGLCLILDIPYNEILGVQVFFKKCNKGDVKSSVICKLFICSMQII